MRVDTHLRRGARAAVGRRRRATSGPICDNSDNTSPISQSDGGERPKRTAHQDEIGKQASVDDMSVQRQLGKENQP